jgi:hypothetical protein
LILAFFGDAGVVGRADMATLGMGMMALYFDAPIDEGWIIVCKRSDSRESQCSVCSALGYKFWEEVLEQIGRIMYEAEKLCGKGKGI